MSLRRHKLAAHDGFAGSADFACRDKVPLNSNDSAHLRLGVQFVIVVPYDDPGCDHGPLLSHADIQSETMIFHSRNKNTGRFIAAVRRNHSVFPTIDNEGRLPIVQ